MDIKIQKKEGFMVAGLKKMEICNTLCPEVWDELFTTHPREVMERLGNGQAYGICFDLSDAENINYMAAYDLTKREAAVEVGLDLMDIPAGEYAVVPLRGPVPQCILDGWEYVTNTYFPEEGYKHSGAPDLEVYGEGDLHAPDYEMELWVPVMKV